MFGILKRHRRGTGGGDLKRSEPQTESILGRSVRCAPTENHGGHWNELWAEVITPRTLLYEPK